MSLRLFTGYFFALAACATIAFSASDSESSSPPADTAELMPAYSSFRPGAFPARHHRLVSKRPQIAQAE